MTYNIRLDTPVDGPNRWTNRRDLFISQLRLLRPAVLGMQEVLPNQRADLVAALPDYAFVGGGRDDGRNAGEASPLAIDRRVFRIAESGMFWLSPTPQVPSLGWDAAYRRVATWARLVRRTDGAAVLAINTHWDNVGWAARAASARQLLAWIKAQRRPGEAVVLLGDFNAPLGEASLLALTHAGPDGVRLDDSRAAAREPVAGGSITFNDFVPLPVSGETIDHIFVAPPMWVQRHHVLAETFDGRVASDHFPVIADLGLACRRR